MPCTKESKSMDCKINKRLLPVKATYFLLYGSLAVLLPYIPIYMQKMGLFPMEIAIIISTICAFSAPTRFVFGIIADKLNAHVVIVVVCCILTGLLHLCLLWVPKAELTLVDECRVSWNGMRTSCSLDHSALTLCQDDHVAGMHGSWQHLLNTSCADTCVTSCCDANKRLSVAALAAVEHSSNHPAMSFSNCTSVSFDKYLLTEFALSRNHCRQYTSDDSLLSHEFCANAINQSCTFECFRNANSTQVPHGIAPTRKRFDFTFWLFYGIFFAAQATFGPVMSIVDSVTFLYLGEEGRMHYGRQRVFGTISLLGFVLLSGATLDWTQSFVFAFVAFPILISASSFCLCCYRVKAVKAVGSMTKNVQALLKNIQILYLLATVTVVGLLSGVQESYFMYYLAATLGAHQLLMGISMFAACLAEVFILLLSGRIIAKIGTEGCYIMVCLAFVVRFIAYVLLDNAWWAVATEMLHGICFGLFYATATSHASQLAQEGMQGATQGLIATFYFGIGRAVGAAMGGAVYEN